MNKSEFGDVTLDLGENLTIGSGASEDINVGTAPLTLKPGTGGTVEKDGSDVVAGALQLKRRGDLRPDPARQSDSDPAGDDRWRCALPRPDAPGDRQWHRAGHQHGPGSVQIQTGGILTVKSAISTTPGGGGKLSNIGKESNVKQDAPINLGTGNVTFTVPG